MTIEISGDAESDHNMVYLIMVWENTREWFFLLWCSEIVIIDRT
jgi:hypothetical protein